MLIYRFGLQRVTDFLDDQHGRLLLWVPCFLAIGICLYFLPQDEPGIWPWLLVLFISITIRFCFCWNRVTLGLVCLIAWVAIGFLAASLHARLQLPMPALPKYAVVIEGKVIDYNTIATNPDTIRVTLQYVKFLSGIEEGVPPLRRFIRIRLHKNDTSRPEIGDIVRVRVMLSRIPPPVFVGARDLQREGWFSGWGGSGYALGPAVIVQSSTYGFPQKLRRLRKNITNRIQAIMPPENAGVAAAMLTGIADNINSRDRDAYASSGLAHLLAVAGLHLGIVMMTLYGVIFWCLTRLEYIILHWPVRKLSMLLSYALGGVYVVLTGVHIPALRSFIMAGIAVMALLAGCRLASMRGLTVAVGSILLMTPQSLLEIPLLMSWAAVMVLIAGYEIFHPVIQHLKRAQRYKKIFCFFIEVILSSFLAGMAVLPVSLVHFDRIQPYFIFANLIAVPLTAFWVLPLGMVALLLMPLEWEILALTPMSWGITCINHLARWVASWPLATLSVQHPPFWSLPVSFAGLLALCLLRGKIRLSGIILILGGMTSGWFHSMPNVIIHANGRMALVNDKERLVILSPTTPNGYIFEQWQIIFGMLDQENVHIRDLAEYPYWHCSITNCYLRPDVLFFRSHAFRNQSVFTMNTPSSCKKYKLFLSLDPIPDNFCPSVLRVDRFTVWYEGTTAMWFGKKYVHVLTDRQYRGRRLWVSPPSDRGVPSLPLAKTE